MGQSRSRASAAHTTWTVWTHFCSSLGSTRLHSMSPTQLPFSKCSHTDIGAANYLPAALKSEVEQWETPFEPLGRRSPIWDTLIPA